MLYIRRMSSLCFGRQHDTEADGMGEFEFTVLSNSSKMIKIDENML
jgi:hypothetical protein